MTDSENNARVIKMLRVSMDFWGRSLAVRDVCINFEVRLKGRNLVNDHPNITKLCEINNLNLNQLLV